MFSPFTIQTAKILKKMKNQSYWIGFFIAKSIKTFPTLNQTSRKPFVYRVFRGTS